MCNPHFGSLFRTAGNRTLFFYNVGRYADLYTSSINNFLQYPVHYAFIARRQNFPHERILRSSRVVLPLGTPPIRIPDLYPYRNNYPETETSTSGVANEGTVSDLRHSSTSSPSSSPPSSPSTSSSSSSSASTSPASSVSSF